MINKHIPFINDMSMNKIIILIALTLLPLFVSAKEKNETENHFFADFIIGKYQLIGKSLNSDETYVGEFELVEVKRELSFIKSIDGKFVRGKATVEKTMSGSTQVLRLNYKQLNKSYEETCLFNSDLDNYARITCHLYEKGVDTKNPGLEAMFIKQVN